MIKDIRCKESHTVSVCIDIPDKYLELGFISLISMRNEEVKISTRSLSQSLERIPDTLITNYRTLMQLEPHDRMHVIESSAIMLIDNFCIPENKIRNLLMSDVYILNNVSTVAEALYELDRLFLRIDKPYHRSSRLPQFASTREILTKREYEVLGYIAKGKGPSYISSLMALSPKTVSSYKQSAMKKLNLVTNIALYHWLSYGGLDGILPEFFAL